MNTFNRWLEQQIDRDDPVGDVARDAQMDKRPKPENYDGWVTFLKFAGACPEAMDALDQAYGKFARHQQSSPRARLTTDTPNTLIVGVAGDGRQTAITASLRLHNGDIEAGVTEVKGDDTWATIVEAMDDLRIVRAKHLVILTTMESLHGFLRAPIHIEQPTVKKVRVGRQIRSVRVGGNEHQWQLLRQLFCYVWRCEKVERLAKAEALLR